MREEQEMAAGFFGFGRWEAPFWFVGPEPGGGNNDIRAKLWKEQFSKSELLDCREFHNALILAMNEHEDKKKDAERVAKFFRESTEPVFQPT